MKQYQNFFGFGQTADIKIELTGQDARERVPVKLENGQIEKQLLFYDGETVSGEVSVNLKHPGKKLEHQGIKVEFLGHIELFFDRGTNHEFSSVIKELAPPGEMTRNQTFSFEFKNVEKPYETYTGINAKLRYVVRVTITRRLANIVKEKDLAVYSLASYPELKYMELSIIRRETTEVPGGQSHYTENQTITKYEIMDGAPVKGESIPIRLFLSGFDLTPTMLNVNKKFSVKYFLNLVLVDEEDRRYFKQQEIILWRKANATRTASAATARHE
eukprot:gene2067-5126_t